MANGFDLNTALSNPWTQVGLSLLAGSESRTPWSTAADRLSRQRQMEQQLLMAGLLAQERKSRMAAAQQAAAAQEAFRSRMPEYMTSPIGEAGPEQPQFMPQRALQVGMETGAIDPMQGIQQAMKQQSRYKPVGGNLLFDTETDEFIQGPQQPVKLGATQALVDPETQRVLAQGPRYTPAPPPGAASAAKPRFAVMPDESSPTGYSWQPVREGAPATAPGRAASREEVASSDAVLGQIDELKGLVLQGERPYGGVVGPKGAVSRITETARGMVPGQGLAPTPALDYQAKRELLLSNIRKAINRDPNFSKADRQHLEQALGEAATSGTAGSAINALENVANFIKARQGKPKEDGGLSAEAQGWIERAMQANPGMTREAIIEEGRKRGKLR